MRNEEYSDAIKQYAKKLGTKLYVPSFFVYNTYVKSYLVRYATSFTIDVVIQ